MLPVILSLGPVKIYSYGVCLAIGVFISLYFWWKMGRDEHFDEIALFDAYFLSLLIFVVMGRAGYVLSHWGDLGSLYRSLAILAYPGLSGVVGMIFVVISAILFARSHDWDSWKVMDMLSVSLSLVLVFAGLGAILNGTQPLWYLNVWQMVWALITFGVVSRVRKNFRFYAWYKREASIAPEGLASLVFLALVGVYYFPFGLIITLVAIYLIFLRSGRFDPGSLIQWLGKRRG